MHQWKMKNINTICEFISTIKIENSLAWSAFLFYISYAGDHRWERMEKGNWFGSDSEIWVVRTGRVLRDDLIQCPKFTNKQTKTQEV